MSRRATTAEETGQPQANAFQRSQAFFSKVFGQNFEPNVAQKESEQSILQSLISFFRILMTLMFAFKD